MTQPFDPNSEAALLQTAMLHFNRGELAEAERACNRVLAGNPSSRDAAHLVGVIALQRHDAPLAVKWLTRAAIADPNAETLLQLANAYVDLNHLKDAAEHCQHALALDPRHAGVHHLLGLVRHWQHDSAAAIASLEEALRLKPDFHQARIDLGRAQIGAGDYAGARRALEPMLAAAVRYPDAHVFYGIACHEQGDFEKAVEQFEIAIELEPDPAETLCNLANVHRDAGNFERAAECYERVLALTPDSMEARNDYACALLTYGHFDRAWELYEARWEANQWQDRTLYRQPPWQGQPLAGKRLLVWDEQGIGDQIMFAGILPQVAALAASCTLACAPKLAQLFRRAFPAIEVVESGSPQHRGLLEAPFDYQTPIASLGRYCRRSLADFPQHSGYLRADPAKVEAWRKRLAALGPGRKVGISWRGGFPRTRRHLRSIDLEAWLPILRTPGVEFISLQYTDCVAEIAALKEKHGVVLHHWPEAIDDYDETAALVCALDCVVSVCTALVHLTGALGRPAWVLVPAVPEWRYQREGNRMPWYPSVELFRQRQLGDWGPVIGEIAGRLGR